MLKTGSHVHASIIFLEKKKKKRKTSLTLPQSPELKVSCWQRSSWTWRNWFNKVKHIKWHKVIGGEKDSRKQNDLGKVSLNKQHSTFWASLQGRCLHWDAKQNKIWPPSLRSFPLEQVSADYSQRGQMVCFCTASALKMGFPILKG